MKIERANRRTGKPEVQEYRFRAAQLIVRDHPSLPVEMEALAGIQFNSSEVVARALRDLIHMDQETFIALHLNGRLKISASTVVGIGTISSSLVQPR
jgi:DNA repair protein RadC